MTNHKIGCLQLFCLTFFLSHVTFLFFGKYMITCSGSDTLFACLLGLGLNLILVKGLLSLRRKHPTLSFHSRKTFSLITLLMILLLTFFLLQETATFIQGNYLKNASLLVITLLLLVIALSISKKELPQVASLSLLLFFLFVPLFATNIIGSATNLNFSYIKPPLITGILPLLTGALLFCGLTFGPLLILLFIPYQQIDQQKKQNKYIYLALIISNLVTTSQMLMIGFGPSFTLAEIYQYPYMLVINKISSFLIFDRISFLLSLYLLFDSTIVIGLLITLLKSHPILQQSFLGKYILVPEDSSVDL